MTKLNQIISALVLTAMLSLPLFAAAMSVRPNVSWSSGPSTSEVSWSD